MSTNRLGMLAWLLCSGFLMGKGQAQPMGQDGLSGGINLQVTGMEITQAVQNLDNSIPLIAGKNTFVRLHVRVLGGSSVTKVKAQLTVTRILQFGLPQELGVLQPLNTQGDITVKSTPNRQFIEDSFLFQLPATWRSGRLRLLARVDPANAVPETNETDNIRNQEIQFRDNPEMRLALVLVDYPGADLPSGLDISRFLSWMGRAYPVGTFGAQLRVLDTQINWTGDSCNCTIDPMTGKCAAPGTCANDPARSCTNGLQCGCARLNTSLQVMRNIDFINSNPFLPNVPDPDYHENRRYYGMVDDSGGFMRGCSPGTAAPVASGPTGPTAGTSFEVWDNDGSYGDWYGGHELAHSFGRPHAPCCDASGSAFFPHPNCQIGTGSATGMFGFDTGVRLAFAPPLWKDYMSYCDYQWTSDYTYQQILSRLDLEEFLDGPFRQGQAAPEPYFLVTGRVDFELPTGKLETVYRMETANTPPEIEAGEFTLRLEDAAGGMLQETSFAPAEIYDDNHMTEGNSSRGDTPESTSRVGQFSLIVPALDNVARLEILQGDTVLDTRIVSANPPTVRLVPTGPQRQSRSSLTVEWMASDQDNDPLVATLLYSSDAGDTWTTVATDLTGSSHTVDLRGLRGGSQSLLRVLVSDGFHTAESTSAQVFEVANAQPSIWIVNPTGSASLNYGQPMIFEAMGQDPEDGALDPNRVEWTSDRQGPLGTGLSIESADLEAGPHVITAEATDSGGASETATTQILVVNERDVPVAWGWLALLLALPVGWVAWTRLRASDTAA